MSCFRALRAAAAAAAFFVERHLQQAPRLVEVLRDALGVLVARGHAVEALDAALVGRHFIVAEALGRVQRDAVAHAVPGAEGALALDVADRRARDPVLARRFLVGTTPLPCGIDVTELRVGLPVAALGAPVQRRHRAVFPLVGLERRGIEREFGVVSAARRGGVALPFAGVTRGDGDAAAAPPPLLFTVTGLSAVVHSTQRRTCRAFHAFLENASCGLSSRQALHVFIVVDIDVASSSADRSKPSGPASSTSGHSSSYAAKTEAAICVEGARYSSRAVVRCAQPDLSEWPQGTLCSPRHKPKLACQIGR